MAQKFETVAILTYHSISNEPGPTSIPPQVFQQQMAAVFDREVDVFSLMEVEEWLKGKRDLARRTIAITFDDAFQDFADAAFPVLEKFDFPATVFVPTQIVGGSENWVGANKNARALMEWAVIRTLHEKGVSFGSHTQFHSDLTTLNENELEGALANSKSDLAEFLGVPTTHFAPPYGRSNSIIREAIKRHYSLSVGVGLGEASRVSPINDLPRIEMHYYRDIRHWNEFLEGRGGAYLGVRQAARRLKMAAGALHTGRNQG